MASGPTAASRRRGYARMATQDGASALLVFSPTPFTLGQSPQMALAHFKRTTEIDWLLPGIPPTGRVVEVPTVAIVKFEGDKLVHEHIYWDQASVLVQVGLLDPKDLPVAGAETAHKVVDKTRPSNQLMARWATSEGKSI